MLPVEALRFALAPRTRRFVGSALRTVLRPWLTLPAIHGAGDSCVGRRLQRTGHGSLPAIGCFCQHKGPLSFLHYGDGITCGRAYGKVRSPWRFVNTRHFTLEEVHKVVNLLWKSKGYIEHPKLLDLTSGFVKAWLTRLRPNSGLWVVRKETLQVIRVMAAQQHVLLPSFRDYATTTRDDVGPSRHTGGSSPSPCLSNSAPPHQGYPGNSLHELPIVFRTQGPTNIYNDHSFPCNPYS
ncbi:hypothetical protein Cgig2_022676 [Carnegiea gigantea]|uniref:Uncharacterized protein n=1 Tax=Carnegiea gigantea TaxID=171969 RepID=A0A9Q1QFK5_9CARY|nr:hypothetical protein Cgig2_022676 [Carnegiea gigantea]